LDNLGGIEDWNPERNPMLAAFLGKKR